MGKLSGRVALVTGGDRGVGAAAARALAVEGAHVVLVARSVGALEETDDRLRQATGRECATLVPLDLTEADKIDGMAAAIHDRWGKLDILIGNAATLGMLTPVGHFAPRIWDEAIAVNLTANWRLIRAFDPLLRQSDAGRAIFVTCDAAKGLPYWGAYSATKAALEALARSWAAELRQTNVRVNIFNPGAVATRIRAQAFPGEEPSRLPRPDAIAPHFVSLASPSCARHGETVTV